MSAAPVEAPASTGAPQAASVSPFGDAPVPDASVSPFGDQAVSATHLTVSPFGDRPEGFPTWEIKAGGKYDILQAQVDELLHKLVSGPGIFRPYETKDLRSQLANLQGELIEGMLSPANILMAVVTGGTGLAAREGLAAARVASPILNRAVAGTGVIQAAANYPGTKQIVQDPNATLPEKAVAVAGREVLPVGLAAAGGAFGELAREAGVPRPVKNVTPEPPPGLPEPTPLGPKGPTIRAEVVPESPAESTQPALQAPKPQEPPTVEQQLANLGYPVEVVANMPAVVKARIVAMGLKPSTAAPKPVSQAGPVSTDETNVSPFGDNAAPAPASQAAEVSPFGDKPVEPAAPLSDQPAAAGELIPADQVPFNLAGKEEKAQPSAIELSNDAEAAKVEAAKQIALPGVDSSAPTPLVSGHQQDAQSAEPSTESFGPVPPEAPTEEEFSSAPITEPESNIEPFNPGDHESVEQLRQQGEVLSPREITRSISRVNAIDKELSNIEQRQMSLGKRAWRTRADLDAQANLLRLERLQNQVKLGDPAAEAALNKWFRQHDSEIARNATPEEVTLKYLSKNRLPATATGSHSGDLKGLELPRKYQMTPNESKTAIRDLALKYNISLEEAANQHGDLERFSKGLARKLSEDGLPEFQKDSGVLTGGASGLIDLVDRAVQAEASGTVGKRVDVPVVPLKETPMIATARRLKNQAGFITIPHVDLSRVSYNARKFVERLNSERKKLIAYWRAGDTRQGLSVTRDVADNEAKLYARQSANDFRGDLDRTYVKPASIRDRAKVRETAQDALSLVVEANGKLRNLAIMRAKVAGSPEADPYWKQRFLKAVDFADKNWNHLEGLADDYNRVQDAQLASENAAGIVAPHRQGYVFHAQDVEEPFGAPSALGGGTDATKFRMMRTYPTFADSIAAGVDPHTLSAPDLMEARLGIGARMVNARSWLASLHNVVDPSNGQPIAAPIQVVTRPDATTYNKAPDGYHTENMAGTPVAVQNGYGGIFDSLTNPSRFADQSWGRIVQRGNATGKSLALLFDTFHMGRVALASGLIRSPLSNIPGILANPKTGLAQSSLTGPSYRLGVALLDLTPQEFANRVRAGDIPQRFARQYIQNKAKLDRVIANGLNVGKVADAIHQEWVRAIPFIGQFNKWVFEDLQRGAMAEIAIMEFDRQKTANPGMSDDDVAKNVAREINTKFGNFGRQGWIKSQTGQDVARLLALAPQWNEGLIRSEIQGAAGIAKGLAKTALGKRFAVSLLGRQLLGYAVGLFLAAQTLNYYTRGHPTWQNPEKGFGAKISAWIQDFIGKEMGHEGPGFFFNPLGMTAEITHLLITAYEREGDVASAAWDFARSRASMLTRPAIVAATGRDSLGRPIRPADRAAAAAKSAVPFPLAAPAAFQATEGVLGGGNREAFPGQFQKQLMQSFGIRTDQAPSAEQRLYSLASDFNRTKGIQPSAEFYTGDYQPLVHALQTGNQTDARVAAEDLLRTKTPVQAFDHLVRWPLFPFTGQARREAEFKAALNPEEAKAYNQAVANKIDVARQALSILHQVDPQTPQISDSEFARLMTVEQADKVATLEHQDIAASAKSALQQVLALAPSQRAPLIAKIQADPRLAAEVENQLKTQGKNLTLVEKRIEALPVATGARARFILQEALSIPPGPERGAYLKNLQDKNVITPEVEDQISSLASQQSPVSGATRASTIPAPTGP